MFSHEEKLPGQRERPQITVHGIACARKTREQIRQCSNRGVLQKRCKRTETENHFARTNHRENEEKRQCRPRRLKQMAERAEEAKR